jgi:hypothetical protein
MVLGVILCRKNISKLIQWNNGLEMKLNHVRVHQIFGKGLVQEFLVLGCWVMWKVGKGDQVRLGKYPWVGEVGNFHISQDLKSFLREHSLIPLAYIGVQGVQEIWL